MSSRENADYLLRKAMEAGISDPKELANFMGQMQVESGGFSRMSENLRYSGKRLLEIFPGRNGLTNLEAANAIAAAGPESVANAIYGGNWGKKYLGNTVPGDGWAFHGRGYVQLTGRANYERIGEQIGLDLVAHPQLAEDKDVAARIAVHYWKSRVVPHGHQQDVKAATRDINGGYSHLAERRVAARSWEGRLEHGDARESVHPRSQKGGHGRHPNPGVLSTDTRQLQQLLNKLGHCDARGRQLHTDGDFGQHTHEAVLAFQHAHGLKQDGIVGPKTLLSLHNAEQSPSPLDPAHADHTLYRQTRAAVQRLDHAMARVPDAASERLAANLTVLAKQHGLSRVDHVVLSVENAHVRQGQHVFVVQGRLEDPAQVRAFTSTQAALETPEAESFRQLEAFNRHQQREHARQHAYPAPGHAQQAEYRDGPRQVIAP